MNPALESTDTSSGSEDGMPRVSRTIIAMLDLLDKLDNLLAKSTREILLDTNNPTSFPISEDDFNVVIAAKNQYREADYGTEEVRAYLLRLPEFDEIWGNVCRGILRFLRHDPDRGGEWHLWLVQVERVGTLAWHKALNAAQTITTIYPQGCGTIMTALVRKFAVVDELLDQMYREFQLDKRAARFSTELQDSLEALVAMSKRGAELTPETLQLFKAAVREERARRQIRWTNPGPASEEENSGSLRRRHPAPGHNAGEEPNHSGHASDLSTEKGASNNAHQYDPTIFTLIVPLSIAAACLTGFAWTKADDKIGSLEDDDFWLLLQSSLLQLTGMVPIVFSLPRSGPRAASLQPRAWSWVFLAGGVGCAFVSPILYLAVPTKISGAVSCIGGISQAFLILEAMFLAGRVLRQSDSKGKNA